MGKFEPNPKFQTPKTQTPKANQWKRSNPKPQKIFEPANRWGLNTHRGCIHFFCVIFALRQRKGRTSQYGLLSMLRRQLCVSSWHRFFIRDKVQQKYLRCHKWLSMFRSCFGALNWMRPILYSAKFFFWTFDSQRTIWLMKYIYCALTWLPPTWRMFSWQCSCIHSSCMIIASRQRQWRTSQSGLLSMLRQLCVSQWQRFFIRCIKLQKAPTLS